MAPRERNGPKGIASLPSARFTSMSGTPTRVPSSELMKIIGSTAFHPRKAPSIASNLMSPPPIHRNQKKAPSTQQDPQEGIDPSAPGENEGAGEPDDNPRQTDHVGDDLMIEVDEGDDD